MNKTETAVKERNQVTGKVRPTKKGRPKRPNMKSYQVRLNTHLVKRADSYAQAWGVGRSQVLTFALEQFLEQRAKILKLAEI